VPLTDFGGLISEVTDIDVPEGASPFCYNNDFQIGSVLMRPGEQSVYSFSGLSSGPNGGSSTNQLDAGVFWINPNNILALDGAVTTANLVASGSVGPSLPTQTSTNLGTPPVPWANPQNITLTSFNLASAVTLPGSGVAYRTTQPLTGFNYGFNLPLSTVPTGFTVSFNQAYTTPGIGSAGTWTVQLSSGQVPVGTAKTAAATLGSERSTITLGGSADLWGTSLSSADVNAQYFGVTLIFSDATGTGNDTVGVNAVKITVTYAFVGVSESAQLNVLGYGFSVAATSAITGIQVGLYAKQTGTVTVEVYLLKGGVAVTEPKILALPPTGAITPFLFGDATDNWGQSWAYSDVNSSQFGVGIRVIGNPPPSLTSLDYVSVQVFTTGTSDNFNYVKTYAPPSGSCETLALDANGVIWGEDVIGNPNVLVNLFQGIVPNAYCKSVTQFGREYMCFSDLTQGTDVPRQYDGTDNFDRISQVGPGAAPSVIATSTSYPIKASPLGITQAPSHPFQGASWTVGLNNQAPGNVITLFYNGAQDPLIILGSLIYISGMSGAMAGGNGTQIVTSVGLNLATNQYYFTYSVSVSQAIYGAPVAGDIAGATYQVSLATLTLTTPAADVSVGDSVTLSGVTIGAWDGAWTITAELNGAQLSITSTSLTANVASYGYTLVSGTTPLVGQLITVTGTLNGNGIFNVTQQSIVSIGGGTITIALTGPNTSAAGETGNAVVNASIFQFDPGTITVGTLPIPGINPIYGNSGGGTLTTGGNIGAGTRRCVLFFLTRNGEITPGSPFVQFDTVGSANSLTVNNILIGPPDTIARILAFTGSGANGVAGGFYFYIPNPVTIIDNGVSVTYSATIINDNTSTSWTGTFTDSVLLASLSVDQQGSDYLSNVELGNSVWAVAYAGRMLYGGEEDKVYNYLNCSFDGGFQPLSTVTTNITNVTLNGAQPPGWTAVVPNGTLQLSPIFGFSYYISGHGLSGTSSLVVDLFDPATGLDYPFIIPFASMTSVQQTYIGTLNTTGFPTVPSGLLLRVYAEEVGSPPVTVGMLTQSAYLDQYNVAITDPNVTYSVRVTARSPSGNDVELDRIEVFPTEEPILSTQVTASYVNAPEQFDSNTGFIGLAETNEQPTVGAFVLWDILYFLKTGSMFSTSDSANSEPSGWDVHEVSNVVGAVGPLAYDQGEEWVFLANRQGVFIFSGGSPVRINTEIGPTWEAINWTYGNTIWLRNDQINRRVLIGVPMATPNQWLPNAPVNANPTSPNVILVMNYRELNTAAALENLAPMKVTFSGKLVAWDMSRKWSIWTLPTPYADFIQRPDTSNPLFLCNGIQSSKIYQLLDTQLSDDGVAIDSVYTTFGFVKPDQEQMFGPLVGNCRKMYRRLQLTLKGAGLMNLTFLQNVINCYRPRSVPGGITLNVADPNVFNSGQFDLERKIDIACNRMFFQFRMNQVGGKYTLSKMLVRLANDPMSPITGAY
jgi:hypothetical protein